MFPRNTEKSIQKSLTYIGKEKYELFKRQFKIDKDNLKAKPLTYRDCQLF